MTVSRDNLPHCASVSLAQDGAGLGAMWGEELALAMLADAGFTDVKVEQRPHDIMNNLLRGRGDPVGQPAGTEEGGAFLRPI